RVAFVARMGDDSRGEELTAHLAGEGVDVRHVLRGPGAPTGVALIMVDHRGRKQILTAPGANRHLTVADVEAATAIREARVVLSQLEVPLETVSTALRLAREAGARVVLDPAPAIPLPDEVLRLVDLVRANSSEAEVLTTVKVRDR